MESQDKDLNTELNSDLEIESPPDVAPVEPQAEEPGYAVPPSPKKSKAPLIIGIVAALLLCIVCVVGVVLARQYLPFLAPKRAAAGLMPADTAFFTSINVDIEDALGYKHLDEVYSGIPEFEGALDDFSDQLEDELDISYKDDVKPWLGPEVAIAIGNMKDLFEGEEPVVIIAAATRDTKASDAFLEKMLESLEDQDYDVDEETYQDVAYYVANPENDWETPMVFGTVKKHLILTTHERIMEQVIDVAKGDSDSLADKERYTKLVGALPDDAVAYMFFDVEDLAKAGLQGLESEGFGLDLPRESSEQLEAFQAFGLALSLDTEGIQFDVAMAFDPDALPPEALESFRAEASPDRILKQIPDDALGFLSGQDLSAFWKSAFASLMDIPDAEEQFGDLEDATGLKLDEELLDWLSGEFAIALVKAKGIENVPVGGFAIFEIDDQEVAEDALGDMFDALEGLGGLEFEKEKIGVVEMQVLRDPYGEEIILGYGFTDKHLVIGFSEDALEEATNDDIRSITADETFKKVQKHLPDKTGGCVYVNVEAVWRLAYRNMSDEQKEIFDEEIRPFLEPIVAIGMGAPPTDPKKGVSQGTLFIYIPGE